MRIYIGGDSWGCGEWGMPDPLRNWSGTQVILHRGLEQYLLDDGHSVTNTSGGGDSNMRTYDKILNSKEHDIYIIFQTISLRDNHEWNTILTWKNLIARNKKLQKTFYKRLGSLASNKIYLLGGLEKVDKDEVAKYPNLVTVVESIPEWLTNGDYINREGSLLTDINNLGDNLPKDVELELLDKLIELDNQCKSTVSFNRQYFQPDGFHPNKEGHYRIYQELKLQQIIN